MVMLADVLAWLKELVANDGHPIIDVASWTIARLDASKERVVGVWQEPSRAGSGTAIGGPSATLTRTKRIQVVLHWTRNAKETEEAAQALHDALASCGRPTVAGHAVSYVELGCPEPIDLGADESGTFERTIFLTIHYQQATQAEPAEEQAETEAGNA